MSKSETVFSRFGQTFSGQREAVELETGFENRGLIDLEKINWGRRTKSLD